MNYKINHSSKWAPTALGLTKSQEQKIDKVISDAMSKVERNIKNDFSFDELIGEVAPHLITPEEAFWGAMCLSGYMMEAAMLHISKDSKNPNL